MPYVIPTQSRFPTSAQVPDQSIMNIYGKQTYLGNQFGLTLAGFSLGSAAELKIALLSVPATAGVSMFLGIRRVSAVGSATQFKFYVNPTATIGTAATQVSRRPANTVRPSIVVCSSAPTASVSGTLISTLEVPSGNISVSTTDSDLIILDPGQSMLITGTPAAATLVSLNLIWSEI